MANRKTVLVFGTFDKLHQGHQDFFRQAKEFGSRLVVVVARDNNVARIKGRRPAEAEKARLGRVKGVSEVDEALLGEPKMSYNIVLRVRPDIIALGYDQAVDMDKLKVVFKGKVIRLKPFKPEIYKSSKLK